MGARDEEAAAAGWMPAKLARLVLIIGVAGDDGAPDSVLTQLKHTVNACDEDKHTTVVVLLPQTTVGHSRAAELQPGCAVSGALSQGVILDAWRSSAVAGAPSPFCKTDCEQEAWVVGSPGAALDARFDVRRSARQVMVAVAHSPLFAGQELARVLSELAIAWDAGEVNENCLSSNLNRLKALLPGLLNEDVDAGASLRASSAARKSWCWAARGSTGTLA